MPINVLSKTVKEQRNALKQIISKTQFELIDLNGRNIYYGSMGATLNLPDAYLLFN